MAVSVNKLWSAVDAAEATGGRSVADWHATGVSIDSRTIRSGDLFVALPGPNFDGHEYVLDALQRGAAASLVSRRPKGISEKTPLLEVADTVAGLNQLGIAGRARARARIIAVTGSVGKTSIKDALGVLLGHQGTVSYSLGSLNNNYGVSLSLARLPANSEFGVFELGMNHAGELTGLSQIVRPLVAIVTTVEPTHLEYFESVEDIARAKAEVFIGQDIGGMAILNRDNPHFPILRDAAISRGIKIVTFGEHREADFRLASFDLGSEYSLVHASFVGGELSYRLKVPGRHWVQKSLAVLAAIHSVGADVFEASRAFEHVVPLKGRGLRHRVRAAQFEVEIIDDSYNASPASVAAALAVLSRIDKGISGRRIAVLGDMLELGPESKPFHLGLAQKVVENRVDLVYAVGPKMRNMYRELPSQYQGHWSETSQELIGVLATGLQHDDVVLVKGSLGTRMGLIVDGLMALGAEG